MNPTELANEFYGMAHDAAMNVMDNLRQEGCGYRMDYAYHNKGICVHFMFRGEVEYTLIVPWNYVQDDNKIRDYYNRFKVLAESARCIPDVEQVADSFIEQELEKLKGT